MRVVFLSYNCQSDAFRLAKMDDNGYDEPQPAVARGQLAILQLPPALAEAAAATDSARFDALVEALAAEWAAGAPGRVETSLQWVGLVNWCGARGGDAERL